MASCNIYTQNALRKVVFIKIKGAYLGSIKSGTLTVFDLMCVFIANDSSSDITGHSIFWNFYSKFWAHIYKPLLCIFGQDVLQAKWKSSFRDIQNRDKYWLGFNFAYKIFRSSRSQMFFKIGVLKIFAFLIKLLAKKETPAQVFYFELCKIFQNIFF